MSHQHSVAMGKGKWIRFQGVRGKASAAIEQYECHHSRQTLQA